MIFMTGIKRFRKTYLSFSLLFLLALFGESFLFPFFKSKTPLLTYLVIISFYQDFSTSFGLSPAFIAGLARDLLYTTPFGQNSLGFLVLGYLTIIGAKHFRPTSEIGRFLLISVLLEFSQTIIFILNPTFNAGYWLAPILTAVLWSLIRISIKFSGKRFSRINKKTLPSSTLQ